MILFNCPEGLSEGFLRRLPIAKGYLHRPLLNMPLCLPGDLHRSAANLDLVQGLNSLPQRHRYHLAEMAESVRHRFPSYTEALRISKGGLLWFTQ